VTGGPGQEGKPRTRSWASPSEVDPGSGVDAQLTLMRDFSDGRISGGELVRSWMSARSRSLANRERVRERFNRILTDFFYVLEDDYEYDPDLREARDLTDSELMVKVREALEALEALDHPPKK